MKTMRDLIFALPLAFGILLVLALAMGAITVTEDGKSILPTQTTTWQGVRKTVAVLSACQGTPAVAARDYATLLALPDANCTIVQVDPRANFYELCFQIDADANTATVEAWVGPFRYDPGSGPTRDQMPRFTLAWSWLITGGKQPAPNSNYYADTIVATQYMPSVGVVSDSAGDRICRFDVDVRGVSYIALLRTDTDPNLTVYVDGRPY